MSKNIAFFLLLFVGLHTVFSTITTTKYSTRSLAEQQNGSSYRRLGSSYFGRSGRISQLQCAKVCTNEEQCKSVYVDGEACVFGVDDVTAFEEGELVTPDSNQVLRVKGEKLLRLKIISVMFYNLYCRC